MKLSLMFADIGGDNRVWLGLYRAGLGDTWRWVDGSETDYVNWRPGQPDQNETEFCALVDALRDDQDVGCADNYPCTDSFNYACEYFPSKFDDGICSDGGNCERPVLVGEW